MYQQASRTSQARSSGEASSTASRCTHSRRARCTPILATATDMQACSISRTYSIYPSPSTESMLTLAALTLPHIGIQSGACGTRQHQSMNLLASAAAEGQSMLARTITSGCLAPGLSLGAGQAVW